MNQMRRTTVTARTQDLATLKAEAKRRNLSLTALVSEAIADKAAVLRSRRQPRVGIARSRDGRSAREVAAEPVA
jgi:hypothetical protein